MSPPVLQTHWRTSAASLFATLCCAIAGVILFNYSKLAALAIFPWAYAVVCFATVFVLSGRLLRSVNFAACCIILLHLADRLKIHYYKEPMMAEDLTLVFDGGNWEAISHYPEAIAAGAVLLAFTALPLFLFGNALKRPGKMRAAAGIGATGLVAMAAYMAHRPSVHNAWLGTLPKGKYVVANLIISATGSRYEPPKFAGNSEAFAKHIAAETFAPIAPETKPDIVLLLQESTVNPNFFSLPPNNFPALKMFPTPDDDSSRMSLLRVHTYGGGTWRTEFDALTGVACTDFGSHANSVFYTVTPHLRHRLPAYLRSQGYHTVVLSPFARGSYNAGKAYEDMGFEEFIQPQDLGYPAPKNANLWHIASADIAKYILQVLREKTGKPVFIYALTMNEHGPYEADTPPGYGLKGTIPSSLAGKVTHYLERLPPLDEAMGMLRKKLEERRSPFLLAYFGDHQPGLRLPPELYKSPYPNPEFITQVVFTGNLPRLPAAPAMMSSNLIPGYLVEAAGLPPDDFFKANITARRRFDGKLDDHADKAAVNDYRAYIHEALGCASK